MITPIPNTTDQRDSWWQEATQSAEEFLGSARAQGTDDNQARKEFCCENEHMGDTDDLREAFDSVVYYLDKEEDFLDIAYDQ